jgi:hypothetical protein
MIQKLPIKEPRENPSFYILFCVINNLEGDVVVLVEWMHITIYCIAKDQHQ